MATREGEGAGSAAGSAALGQRTSRTLRTEPRLEVNYDDLPVDISRDHAQWLQKHVDDVGKAWYSKSDDIAIEFIVAPNDPERVADAVRIFCDSQVALEETLQEIDPETSLVLIMVQSYLSKLKTSAAESGKPRCTLHAMLTICKHFSILPTFAMAMEGNPCLWTHLLPERMENGGNPSTVLSYKAPFPWMNRNEQLGSEFMQVKLFGTSSYTSINPESLPKLTLFANLPTSMTRSIKIKWEESLSLVSLNARCVLYPHYSLVGLCLLEMLGHIKYLEFMQAALADQRFEIHVNCEGADIKTTITQSRKHLRELIFIRGSLTSLRQLLHGLDEEIVNPVPVEHDGHVQVPSKSCTFHDTQLNSWKRNLLRQIATSESRINELIETQRAQETLVLSFMAQRDSASQARNTAQLATLAKATESSGREINGMTHRMELDAKNMRFLAEITAFFLPLTAIATFFSMDFVGISNGPGIVPQMNNLKYIWLYCVTLGATSAVAFGWWYYKHRSSIGTLTTEDVDSEGIEARMEMQAKVDESRRKEYAWQKFDELKLEWEHHKAAKDRGEEVPDTSTAIMLIKLLAVMKTEETGEDYDELVARATVGT